MKRGLPQRAFFVAAAASVAAACLPFRSIAGQVDAQSVIDRFTSARTLSGRFVQLSPDGGQAEGRFKIERPGMARFDYDGPSPLRLLADGRTVAVGNRKLGTWDLYPLSRTPLKLVLGDRLDLSDRRVRKVDVREGTVSVTLADPDLFGNSSVEVTFDAATYALRQWTVTDARKRQTTIVVYDVVAGESYPASDFRIPYSEIRKFK